MRENGKMAVASISVILLPKSVADKSLAGNINHLLQHLKHVLCSPCSGQLKLASYNWECLLCGLFHFWDRFWEMRFMYTEVPCSSAIMVCSHVCTHMHTHTLTTHTCTHTKSSGRMMGLNDLVPFVKDGVFIVWQISNRDPLLSEWVDTVCSEGMVRLCASDDTSESWKKV